ILEMACDEAHRLRVVAMRQRNTGIARTAGGGRDAGHDLKGNAGGCEFFDFFAATPEDEGITTLEAQDTLSFLRQTHQQLADLLLRHGVIRTLLADVNLLRILPRHVE